MSEDQMYDAAERAMDLYRNEISRITEQLDLARAETAAIRAAAANTARELAEVTAERDALKAQVARYENGITWDTTCERCATTLDSAYAETVRAEKAEAGRAELRERITDLAEQVTASAKATEPSRKSQIEHEVAIELRKLLEDQA